MNFMAEIWRDGNLMIGWAQELDWEKKRNFPVEWNIRAYNNYCDDGRFLTGVIIEDYDGEIVRHEFLDGFYGVDRIARYFVKFLKWEYGKATRVYKKPEY